jgi:tungstate transport system ATP-binding protein
LSYRLEGVGVRFDGRKALDGVSLEVREGVPLGLVGSSGAGKTTLLRVLAGLQQPAEGKLLYKGETADPLRLRREATMLFQSPAFLRGSVGENLAYGLRLRGVPEDEIKAKADDALTRVRLPDFSERIARSLSGGEQQRVSLARALVLDPKVLLLDEPTSNLDPANASIISDIIAAEAEKRLIVVATHDYIQVRRLTRRVVYLEAGRVTAEGATEELLSDARYAENVFTGASVVEEGVSMVNVGGGVVIAAAFQRRGSVNVAVSPEDIIVSRERIETSARNQLHGKIVGVEEVGGVIRLRVDAGRLFIVQITKRSLQELGLTVGGEVYLSFKASSVRLIGD